MRLQAFNRPGKTVVQLLFVCGLIKGVKTCCPYKLVCNHLHPFRVEIIKTPARNGLHFFLDKAVALLKKSYFDPVQVDIQVQEGVLRMGCRRSCQCDWSQSFDG